ncbi:hypothetical protein D3870_07195 [Noviherbaspirillum cavernae]|uniref:O-antigen ligase domain-containing protein n=1 Tax=Noviherbaspirillum cavernae TaxID=2320862 RepID=A0A418X062_9BURK|nr:hypothetical protein [Noviherbaspirillum cavernae]RJG05832.1 hypothetical protein D3870_07195 [Noviherbaspirillum cavernae]
MHIATQLHEQETFRRRSSRKTIIHFLAFVSVYLSLLALNYFLKNDALKTLANGFAFLIFAMFLLKILQQKTVLRLKNGYALTFAVLIFGMVCNVVVNLGATDIADYLKMLLSPFFFVIGYLSLNLNEFSGTVRKKMLFFTWMLLLVPSVIAVGEQMVWGSRFQEEDLAISIFANRNNAALYALVLSILFAILKVNLRWILLYLVAVSVSFATLGVLVAVVLGIVVVQIRKGNILYLMLSLMLVVVAFLILMSTMPTLPVFERLMSLGEGLHYLYSSGQIRNLSRMNYGQLSEIMGSSDISFFFRITHWAELLEIYSNGSLESMLFGNGVGSSVRMTAAGLVPHNDYLRYLFECGLFAFMGFLLLNLRIIKDAGSTYAAIPCTAIMIYFFSENLINNFLAMMLFYFLAGFVIARNTAMRKTRTRHEHYASQPELLRFGRL